MSAFIVTSLSCITWKYEQYYGTPSVLVKSSIFLNNFLTGIVQQFELGAEVSLFDPR